MLKIGLTGGMGSGKSTVAKVFQTLGIPVFDADSSAKRIMNEDEGLKKKIIDLFGEAAYSNGILQRKFIADIVFNNPEKLEQLNAVVHPATIAASENWMNKQQTSYAIKEAALMFESAASKNLDYIIGVYAPMHIRIQRVIDRDGLSRDEIVNRLNKQLDEDMKMKLCDFVIINNEQKAVIPQVMSLHKKFLSLA